MSQEQYGFVPHSVTETQAMLSDIGLENLSQLFLDIPESLKIVPKLETLPQKGLDELSLIQDLQHYASQNTGTEMHSFMGGGVYHRFIPPVVNHLAFRSEFYTAYTPYQAEVSQGTLQVIYEFQSMMSELTGMDVTNASVYDGGNAVCEAALMATRIAKKNTVYVASTIHPHHIETLETYFKSHGKLSIELFDPDSDLLPQFKNIKDVAGVIVQNPDYMGNVRDFAMATNQCHDHNILVILSMDVMNAVLLKSPAEMGADIVCGDIQQFGNAVNYGGPYAGFLSVKEKYIRQLPGRLVSQTKDKNGHTAYTLTLQTREQHIRRTKATSNICTNQALNVLKAVIYLAVVGTQGLNNLALLSAQRAHYLANELCKMPGVSLRYPTQHYLNEFALHLPISAKHFFATMARQHNILPGIDLSKYYPDEKNTILIAVTEMNTEQSIKRFLSAFKETVYLTEPNNVTSITSPVIQSKSLATSPVANHESEAS